MKSEISAMMDGELADAELAAGLRELREDGASREAWRTYHLIGDAIRDRGQGHPVGRETGHLSSGFSERMARRLEGEPTVFSPASIPARVEPHRHRLPLSIAASLAAIAIVGWLAFPMTGPQVEPMAQTVVHKKAQDKEVAAAVPMRGEVNDYLMAHQNYSPRSALQGVAPYVRTVSDSSRAR